MANISVRVYGLQEIEDALAEMGGPFLPRLLGPALGAAATVVRRRAATRLYGFTDRTGRLRRSIRRIRIPAEYGGRKYRGGRAAVIAGGTGARQSHLVELGHGGPFPADPHPYLLAALMERESAAAAAFTASAQQRFPRLAAQFAQRRARSLVTASRTIARRHR